MPQSPPTAAEVEEALAAVYSRPEFTPHEPSAFARMLGEAWAWLRARIAEMLQWIGADVEDVGWLGFALLAVALLLIGIWLVRALGDAARSRGRASVARPAPVEPASPRADEWEIQAQAAASAGRWAEATLALYQAVVLRLEERGALRYDEAKTPGDYRREARRALDAAPFEVFLGLFEPIAFGRRPADEEGYAALRDAAEQVGARA